MLNTPLSRPVHVPTSGPSPPRRSPPPLRHRIPPLWALPILGLAACGEELPTAPLGPGAQPEVAITATQRVVNSLADPGDGTCTAAHCTLREAIADPGSATVIFASGLTGEITLAAPVNGGGTLVIDKPLTINGPATGITIGRRPTDPAFRILRIGKLGVVTLRNLTLRNGKTDLPGGGVMNFGTLRLNNCTVTANATTAHGGGIDNHGPLTLRNSHVNSNKGAGIDNHNNSNLVIIGGAISYNTGPGVYNDGSPLQITRTVIGYNVGPGLGQYRGVTTLDRARVVGNTSSGIAFTNGDMTLLGTIVARNGGAGVSNFIGHLVVTGSTIAKNRGEGIRNGALGRAGNRMDLVNSTVSGNGGDGVYIEDDVEAGATGIVVNSTIVYNGGHGVAIHGSNGALIDLTNTISAGNRAAAAPDVYTSNPDYGLVGASHSLIGDGSGSPVTNDNGNIVGSVGPYTGPIDPLLGPLANNGGPTTTHALLAGSPAIDAGTSEGCPATDQRGVARPQGSACDIGSFERE